MISNFNTNKAKPGAFTQIIELIGEIPFFVLSQYFDFGIAPDSGFSAGCFFVRSSLNAFCCDAYPYYSCNFNSSGFSTSFLLMTIAIR